MTPTRTALAALAMAAATALPGGAQNIVTMIDGEVSVGDAAAFGEVMNRLGDRAPAGLQMGASQMAAMPAMPGLDAAGGRGADPTAIACAAVPRACSGGMPDATAAVEAPETSPAQPCAPVRGVRAVLAALFGLSTTPTGCESR